MKRNTKLMIAAGVAVIGIGALGSVVVAKSQDWRQGYGMYRTAMMSGMGHHGGMMGGNFARMEKRFEMHDLNNDGKVTQSELDQSQADRLKQFDADKSGTLSLSEFENVWLEHMRARMVDRFQALDEDGDAIVTKDEFLSPMSRMISRHDLDGDGSVAMKDMMRQGQMMRQGRGWGHQRWFNNDDDDDNGPKK